MEGGALEKPKVSDPVLETEARKREMLGLFELLEDIIVRANVAEEELKKSIDFLHDFQKQKYTEVLKLLQENNDASALELLKTSDEKALHARTIAREIESLMDDLVKETGELSGIIKSEKEN
jgi:hypothetical protein